MFHNSYYVTKGVYENIPPLLQLFMWELIQKIPVNQDDLQVFSLSERGGRQRIVHSQERPKYKKEYELNLGFAVNGKIYVIDDETHSTMLMNYEY